MRKRAATLVVSVLVAVLIGAGCGDGGQEEEPTDSTISSEETVNP